MNQENCIKCGKAIGPGESYKSSSKGSIHADCDEPALSRTTIDTRCQWCNKLIKKNDRYLQVLSRKRGSRLHYGNEIFCNTTCFLRDYLSPLKKGGVDINKMMNDILMEI